MSTSIETPLETKLQVRSYLLAAYRRRDSWQGVADYYGKFSKAAYWRVANEPGYQPPPDLIENVLEKGVPPRLFPIPVYPDSDIDVYYRSGTGSLHTYTVPPDAEVVIVPAGARIVQPKPPAPKRHRVRLDVTRYAQIMTPQEIAEVVTAALDEAMDYRIGDAGRRQSGPVDRGIVI